MALIKVIKSMWKMEQEY